MIVSMTELRARLKDCLDKLEAGEEITIIRHSRAIGRLVPSEEIKAAAEAQKVLVPDSVKLRDNREVRFRQLGAYENSEPVRRLHRTALEVASAYTEDPSLDTDLLSPGSYYPNWDGEFWVGELEGELVAMGAFRLYISERPEANLSSQSLAELKRMRVRPDLQGQGIGSALLRLLESRAKQQGYEALVLDTVVGTPAQEFYARQSYQETGHHQGEKFELVYYRKVL